MEKDPAKFKDISEELLGSGMDVRISTRGLSMFPLVSTGDRITISPEKNLQVGDIIVFKRDGQMVCHRLVREFEDNGTSFYQTRGDSFFGLDDPVTADQVLGKIIRIERGNVSPARRVLLLLFPALRFGRLNARLVSALLRLRRILSSSK